MKGKISEMMPSDASLDEYAVKRIISAYGIPTPKSVLMDSVGRDLELEFPVVVKVSDPKILHKSEVGGVTIGIRDQKQLAEEVSRMRERFPDAGILVEEMEKGGLEIIAGLINDRNFGNAIMLGMGGIYTELYQDVVFRLTPISRTDASEMIDSVKIRVFEKGFRGIRAERDTIIDLLLKLSLISDDIGSDLDMLDLNPVIVNGDRISAVDAKLILKKLP
ncbi:MAG: acetate--CoA ligase family protein [Thermoplasmataceae archaeon]